MQQCPGAGQPARALDLLADQLDIHGRDVQLAVVEPLSIYVCHRHYVALVRQTVGRDAARRYKKEGRAMSEDEAIAYALEGP